MPFTLLELLASMAIFILLMFTLLTFFDSAQKAWTDSAHRSMLYENAAIVFNLIARDLQCIYYEEDKTPFWHKGATNSTWGAYRNPSLNFVSATSITQNNICNSKLSEIKYQLYYASTHSESSDGWLLRSITGDQTDAGADNSKWNYYDNFTVGRTGASNAFSANSDSSEDFSKVIPYVTDLSFTCYKRDGTEITPDTDSTSSSVTEFPYSIRIDITLMDRNSFKKWQALDTAGAPNAATLKMNNERTFSRTILIGERGQYD